MSNKRVVHVGRWCLAVVLMAPLVAAAADPAPAAPSAVVSEDPLERQVLEIAKELRCAVCQNQPISESNADLARDMRNIIREKLQAGETRERIMDYFVQRYGDYVLLKPPLDSAGTVVWLIPPLVFIVLAGAALYFIRRGSRRKLPPAPTLSEEDRARVRAARQQD